MAKAKIPGSLICRGSDPGCTAEGWRCAGIERTSCSGFVCSKHAALGTQKPFTGKTICRVCFTRQAGTLHVANEPSER